MVNKNYTVIDLFAGAGGMSEGFCQEGFKILAANEILECAADTFKHNHPNTKMLVGDIQEIDPKEFLKKFNIEKSKIDLVIGGPPCQGFSMANRQRLVDDSRNKLYKYFLNFVKEANPKFFIMENVKGILSKVPEIIEDFKKIGYFTDFGILNAKDFGIPQHRERIFLIGSKINNSEKLIKKIFEEIDLLKSKKIIPLKDALWGLRELKASSKKNDTVYESEESGFLKDDISNNSKPPKYILEINRGKIQIGRASCRERV